MERRDLDPAFGIGLGLVISAVAGVVVWWAFGWVAVFGVWAAAIIVGTIVMIGAIIEDERRRKHADGDKETTE